MSKMCKRLKCYLHRLKARMVKQVTKSLVNLFLLRTLATSRLVNVLICPGGQNSQEGHCGAGLK